MGCIMIERPSSLSLLGLLAAALLLAAAPAAQAQKIVCWKDKTGKVVGCGDRVPPEFHQNESKTLDNRGIVRGTTVSAEEAARQKAKAQEQAALKAEEDRRIRSAGAENRLLEGQDRQSRRLRRPRAARIPAERIENAG